jgi:type I restriction enzyme S subunit
LDKSFIEKLEFSIPPLPEQKKIASILTSVDEVIENTQKQIDKLQDLKKATMNELLTKGIGHTEFKDSELGRIPKSWEVKKFSHITHLITKGTTPTSIGFSFSESGINFIKVESIVSDGNIDPAKFSYVDENVHNKLRRSQISKEDILITIAGATVGKLAIAEQKFLPANTNQALAIVRLKKEIVRPLFAFYFLQGWYIKTLIERSQTVGAQPNVSLAQIGNFPIPLIDVMEQDLIVESLRSLDKAISDMDSKLSQTQSLKKSLMQDLLTGKVRVTVN